jgi:superfamily II DNA/RNA helicase
MHVTKTFRDLGVHDALASALDAQGITHPFPIQELTLPLALDGHDLIGQARTGTGKTLAFGLPLLQRLDPSRAKTQALVIVPTRELCLQVYEDLKIGAELGLTSISVYGGVGYDEQIDALTTGVHVVVGTPGRLLDHLNRGNLDLSNVTQLVLDEADEMLDMGFLPDVERLVGACQGEDRHTMLFSATMPTPIVKLARRYMDHPTFTRADYQEERTTADNVEQHFFQVHRMDKPRLLARILQDENRGGVYVFVRTKHMADRLVTELEDLDTPAIAIHGDLRQATREKNLDRFRDGRATVLVATEVAARGLDVHGVTHVVNYDCPDDEKMYLHRIGRTARAGGSGKAITFAEFNEIDRLNVIRKKVGATDVEVVQVFSTSPLLAERFALPEERPWDRQVAEGGRSGGDSRRNDRSGSDRPKGGRSEGGRSGGNRSGSGRQGHSDGRPKSGREREGRGGDRDADRNRRPRPAPEEAPAPAPTRADQDETRDRTDAAEQARTGRGERPAPDREAPATRTRKRSRTRTSPAEADRDERSRDDTASAGDADPHEATADRASDATTTTAADRPTPDGDAARAPRTRARSRGRGDAPAARSGGSSGRSRSDAPRSEGNRSERDPDDRDGGDRREPRPDRGGSAGAGRNRGSGGDRRDAGNRSRDGGNRSRDTTGSRARDGGSRSRDTADRGTTVPTTPRGEEARGTGQPQRARRVRVDHLP